MEGGESKSKEGAEGEAGNDDGAISDSDGEKKEGLLELFFFLG